MSRYNYLKFYSEMFGWKIEKWPGPQDYWLVTIESGEKTGVHIAIMRSQCSSFERIRCITDVA